MSKKDIVHLYYKDKEYLLEDNIQPVDLEILTYLARLGVNNLNSIISTSIRNGFTDKQKNKLDAILDEIINKINTYKNENNNDKRC